LEGQTRWDLQEVFLNNPGWQQKKLRIGPVDEQQILTEVGLSFLAEEAIPTRSGVCGNRRHARFPMADPRTDGFNNTGKFVPKKGRGLEHPSMRSVPEDLQIRSTGQGCLDLQ